ncbi:MAG: SUMF1/EgtB/PvdO family nonheme iron enzyme [Chlorobiaceae bacterium]|nr:SUMF1/EgtB/PvdO family nonheme iron enzyme [Chlorobiaceae bacterium]
MAVTWLHVSDFHLSDKGPYNQEVILNALVSSVRRLRGEGHVPDLIFATGDIAQNGKAKEYAYATEFFNALLDAAGLEKERLFIVPGNHDVDRKMGKGLARTLESNDDADEYFDNETPTPHLTQKLQAFSAWYNEYFKGIRTFPTDTTCSQVEVITIRNTRIAVLPLNSALFCIDDNDNNKLFIGRRCLDSAVKQLQSPVEADLKIALLHHPLDWLSPIERANIKATLGAAVDLVLQGHYHETETEGIASANGGYLKLAAGAAYQTRQHPNSAMYATFEGNHVEIFPIHYVDKPQEIWTLDTSIFPAPPYTKSFPVKGFDSSGSPQQPSGNQNADKNQLKYKSYKAIIKVELGYIRMLGLPGIESIKVNLNDDTFVPLRLSDRQENGSNKKNSQQGSEHILYPDQIMKQAFHDRRGRRMLLVIGDPGAGKTTLLKYYSLCALEDYKRLGFTEPVNVFYIPLRELVRDKEGDYISLPANLANWAKKHHQTIAADVFTDWLNSGTSLVLLDGLDEISNTADRIEVCKWIDNAWAGFTKAFFVVTSRSTGYNKEEGIELECDYERADVQDFTPDQQERFLKNWFTAAFLKEPCEEGFDEAGWQVKQTKVADQRTQTIVAHLKAEKNKGLRQLAAIPMILQIMAILWKDREYMPESRAELYDAALNYLLEFRDKRKKIKPLLSAIDARQVLAPVSLWMQGTLKKDEAPRADMHSIMKGRLDTLNTPEPAPTPEIFCNYLVKRAGLLVDSAGREYLFRHKSFREYLAGIQLKEDRPYDQLNTLVTYFGKDWWEEPIRFFFSSVDANIFDCFMEKLFNSHHSEALTPKQQLLLQTIIEEAKGLKVDSLCKKLLDPTTSAGCQRVILDCLKAIKKPFALEALLDFRVKKLAKNKDVAGRTDELIRALGGQIEELGSEKPVLGTTKSILNKNEQNAEYILIPGGSYIYSETGKEEPVADLYVAKYPVTNKLYRLFIAAIGKSPGFKEKLIEIAEKKTWDDGFTKYLKEGKDGLATLFRSEYDEVRKFDGEDQPVVRVTWYAARAYCLWLSLLENKDEKPKIYRLPTEVEWEWAAGGRQGTIGKKVRQYPWADEKGEPTSKLLNYDNNVGATTPVGSYPDGATPEGLYDMAGNVWEWTDSWWNEKTRSNRVLRGGSWGNFAVDCRSAFRGNFTPDIRDGSFGFRLVFVP